MRLSKLYTDIVVCYSVSVVHTMNWCLQKKSLYILAVLVTSNSPVREKQVAKHYKANSTLVEEQNVFRNRIN